MNYLESTFLQQPAVSLSCKHFQLLLWFLWNQANSTAELGFTCRLKTVLVDCSFVPRAGKMLSFFCVCNLFSLPAIVFLFLMLQSFGNGDTYWLLGSPHPDQPLVQCAMPLKVGGKSSKNLSDSTTHSGWRTPKSDWTLGLTPGLGVVGGQKSHSCPRGPTF